MKKRLQELLKKSKLGKRKLGEIRKNSYNMEDCSNYNMHMLVSSDGKELALRATIMYDENYLIVPVLEEECIPWNKQRFEVYLI